MRYLIVRIAAIGDVAMSSTLLARIKAEEPDAHVTWLCGEGARAVVELFPGLDDVIPVDEHAVLRGRLLERLKAIAKLWWVLLRRRFDRVLLLHPDPRYRVLTWPLFRATVNAASHGPGPRANPLRGRYRADEAARLLDGDRWTGPLRERYALADLRDRLPLQSTQSGSRRVVLVPGGARNLLREDARRRWPVASYRVLAEELVRSGWEVSLIGDQHDAQFAAAFDGVPTCNLIGKLSLVETLGELREAALVVTHDTGPMHLARLVRTPVVALFGPTDPREFVGYDPDVTVVQGGEHLPCRPCYDGRDYPPCAHNACMHGITVAEVVAAATRRLGPALPAGSPVSITLHAG